MNALVQSSNRTEGGRLIPRRAVPGLTVPTLDGGFWDLNQQNPTRFTMIVFYRGYHCPVCHTYIRELDRLHGEFNTRGIGVIALSSDTEERARITQEKWGIEHVTIGHSLDIPKAREWGLYISASRGKSSSGIEEPEIFSEPGIFVVRSDRTLYWASTSTMPFARPHFSELIQAFDFVEKLNYPARGEL
ncbi:MAG: alkyl hydroperoxide reductase [Methylobacterium sp.]|nr:MAG: alkyl hydroperoxide reductase [Methylobacterium sp.]